MRTQSRWSIFSIVFSLVLLPLTPVFSGELVTLDTRKGVTQSFLLMEPTGDSKALVLLFPGHKGVIHFRKNLLSEGHWVDNEQGGFTASEKTRETYLDNGIIVALLAPPSDQKSGMDTDFRSSEMHAFDIGKVIDYLRQRYQQGVYLHGHCRGSFSAASVATKLRNEGVSGLILSSPRSRSRRGIGITDYESGVISVPVLLVQHKDDPCKGTLYRDLEQVRSFYDASSPKVDVILVTGGETGSTGRTSCQNKSHSFVGLQRETARAIAAWIEGSDFPRRIHD